jgi:hypothetical protein
MLDRDAGWSKAKKRSAGATNDMENFQALNNGRAGKCYQIALAIIQIGADNLVLVHGHICGFAHAWLVTDDGRIYDPVAHALIDAADYPAIPDRHYSKREALRLAELTGTCGPWRESASI